jgi:hypothetical protein
MKFVGTALRAFFAAAATLIGSLATTLTGDQNFGDITTQQWLIAVGLTLAAFGGVYGISNIKSTT